MMKILNNSNNDPLTILLNKEEIHEALLQLNPHIEKALLDLDKVGTSLVYMRQALKGLTDTKAILLDKLNLLNECKYST